MIIKLFIFVNERYFIKIKKIKKSNECIKTMKKNYHMKTLFRKNDF
jgi:hypothetical protein